MIDHAGIDWEDAYSNVSYILNSSSYPDIWASRAANFRNKVICDMDISYGSHDREVFDLFMPQIPHIGLAIFIHGGFWVELDKSSWSDLAEGALAHGWALAIPTYRLAPEAQISEITGGVSRAIEKAANIIDGPIRLAGHSAGGHLATRMLCDNSPLSGDVVKRIERVVSISGIHDLRPLKMHSMKNTLGLNEEIINNESPVLRNPIPGVNIATWVGEFERPEYIRQSALIAESWRRKGGQTKLYIEPRRHHFDVIDGLKLRDHPLTLTFAGQ